MKLNGTARIRVFANSYSSGVRVRTFINEHDAPCRITSTRITVEDRKYDRETKRCLGLANAGTYHYELLSFDPAP